MSNNAVAEECVNTVASTVHKLVGDDELQWLMLLFQRTNGRDGKNSLHANLLETVDIRPEVQLGRRDPMAAAMTRQECDRPAGQPPQHELLRRRSPGRIDRDLVLAFLRGSLSKSPAPAVGDDPWQMLRRGDLEAARELVGEVGLFEEARRGAQGLPAQARKVEAIESLLRQLIDYEKREEQKAAERLLTDDDEPFAQGLPGYLNRLALDSKEADGADGDSVTLMTLHAAKGLEWRCVFLCGMEEGLLPHSGKGFDAEVVEGTLNLEEERRLCYVGMTRARERLTLTRAAQRTRRGKAIPRTPSRFLDDIPAELCDVIGPHCGEKAENSAKKPWPAQPPLCACATVRSRSACCLAMASSLRLICSARTGSAEP